MEKHREKQKRARESAEEQAKWFEVKVNTSVYITGLPDDATEGEVAQVRVTVTCSTVSIFQAVSDVTAETVMWCGNSSLQNVAS